MAILPKPTSKPDWTEGNPSFATITQEPSAGKKLTGWNIDERPAREYMNWLFYILDQWVKYLESVTDEKKINVVTIASSPYTVLTTDQVVFGDCTTGSQIHTLPPVSGNAGMRVTFKKVDATANTMTIEGDGIETIDGQLNQVIDFQYTSITMVCDGAKWLLV